MEYTTNYNLIKQDESEFYDVDILNDNFDKIDTALGGKTSKSTVLNLTLGSVNWFGSAAPYTYVLAVTGATSSNLIETTTPGTVTDEQLAAYEAVQIKKITQATDTITLYAYGAKPTISLPITIIVRGDV